MNNNGITITDILKLELDDGRTLEQAMRDESIRLGRLLIQHLLDDGFLNSPKMYAWNTKRRVGLLENSLIVNLKPIYNPATGDLSVSVVFDDSRSGGSMFGLDRRKSSWNTHVGDIPYGKKPNLALLIDQGYEVSKDVWFKDIPNFGIRYGSDFIQNALDEFNATNSLGIYIDRQKDVFLV